MSDKIRRLLLIGKMRTVWPTGATNAAPRFAPPQGPPADPVRALRAAGAKFARRLGEAKALLASLRTSKTPVATARQVETITRQAAADLSAARRSAAPHPAPSTRSARRDAARIASTFSAGTAGNFSDGYVADLARHTSTSTADREVAKAELARRGITLYANGNTSRSTRKI
jgi:hypothetical protein